MLDSEQAVEEDLIKRRLANWSLDRLQEEGYCLTSLSGFWLDEMIFGRPIAAFSQGPGLVLPNHVFLCVTPPGKYSRS
jgi:hypothetical protein